MVNDSGWEERMMEERGDEGIGEIGDVIKNLPVMNCE